MEHFSTNQFETFLKTSTEDFKMQPNVRVWKSIFNKTKPGNNWPSISTAILIFFLFCFFGSNKKNHSKIIISQNKQSYQRRERTLTSNLFSTEKKVSKTIITKSIKNTPQKFKTNIFIQPSEITHLEIPKINLTEEMNEVVDTIQMDFKNHKIEKTKNINQHFAFLIHNNNFRKKEINVEDNNEKRNQFAYQIYATPSMDYRYSNNQTLQKTNDSSVSNMCVSFEAGGAFLVNVSKTIRIKAGMQFNYNQSNINNTGKNSDKLNVASLNNSVAIANNKFNNTANIFKNSTYQISIPVGTEFEILRFNKLKWFAGATIQPSYLFINNDHSVFTDLNNKVYLQSMMRHWNVNSSVETFLNFDLQNNIELNFGPQLRYQFLSTYKNAFQQNERLYQLGIKIGICKKL